MKKIITFLFMILININIFAQDSGESLYSGTIQENILFSLFGILMLLLAYASTNTKEERNEKNK